jgi:hypothetical protein
MTDCYILSLQEYEPHFVCEEEDEDDCTSRYSTIACRVADYVLGVSCSSTAVRSSMFLLDDIDYSRSNSYSRSLSSSLSSGSLSSSSERISGSDSRSDSPLSIDAIPFVPRRLQVVPVETVVASRPAQPRIFLTPPSPKRSLPTHKQYHQGKRNQYTRKLAQTK